MRVLDVVHRVLARLLARQPDVEVDGAIVRALEHEEPRGVYADLVEQVIERDEVPTPLGHGERLPALDQVHELQDRRLHRVGIAAERGDRRLQLERVGRMVGTERNQLALEPSVALVLDVGDVRGQIGGLPVGAHHDAVLVVAEARRAQPQRAVGPVHVSRLLQERERSLQFIWRTGVQGALAEKRVEVHLIALERVLDPRQQDLDRARGNLLDRSVCRTRDLRRQVGHVRPLITTFRGVLRPRARLDRLAQEPDLVAGVVEVVLRVHRVPVVFEDPRQRVSVRRVPPAGRDQRPGRVGRHELEQNPLGPLRPAGAEPRTRVEHGVQRPPVPVVGQHQVQEARPRDLGSVELLAQRPP